MANFQVDIGAKVSAAEVRSLLEEIRNGAVGARKALADTLGETVTKTLAVEYVVDDSGARKALAVERERYNITDKLIAAQTKLDKVQLGSVTSLRGQVREVAQTRDGIEKINKITGIVNERWAAQNAKLQQLNRELAIASASGFWDRVKVGLNAQGLVNFSNGLVQITQGLQAASITIGQIAGSVNTLIKALAGLQEFRLAFQAIGQGSAGANQALNESSRIALSLGVNIKSVRQAFQQLSPVIIANGGSIADVSKVVESLSTRFAAFGISGDRAKRVLNAVTQVFAKGKLTAEEFTQQIAEADPAFGTDFAQALGKTTGQLQEMIKAGQVTNDVFLKGVIAINKSAEVFGKLGISAKDAVEALAAGNVTIGQVQGKFESLAQLSLEKLADGLKPLLNALLNIGAIIADFASSLSKLEIVKTLGALFAGFANALGSTLEIVLSAVQALANLANAIDQVTGPLLRIPGIAEAIGFAILAKLIAPLAALRQSLAKTAAEGKGFGALLAKVALGAVKPLEDTDKAARGLGPALANAFKGVTGAFQDFATRSERAKANLTALSQENQKLSTSSARVGGALQQFKTRLAESQAYLDKAKASTDRLTTGFRSFKRAEDNVKQLTRAVSLLSGELKKVENKRLQIKAELEVSREAVRNLGVMPTLFNAARGAGEKLKGVFVGIQNGIKGVLSALGPLGFALAAIGLATKAYNDVNKETTAINERSAQRISTLDSAIEDLGGGAEEAGKPLSGLGIVWAKLGLLVDSLVAKFLQFGEALGKFFDKISTIADSNALAKILGVTAALIGLLTGGVIGAIAGGAIGAVLGKMIQGLSGVATQAALAKKAMEALGSNAQQEAAKILVLLDRIDALNKGGTGGTTNDKVVQGLEQAKEGIKGLQKEYDALKAKQEASQKIVDQASPELLKQAEAYKIIGNAIASNQAQLAQLEKKKGKTGEDRAEIARLKEEIAWWNKKKSALEANSAELTRLGTAQEFLKQSPAQLAKIQAAIDGTTKRYNASAAAAGLLSLEQREIANSYENLNTQLKNSETLLQQLDPSLQAAKWEEVNQAIARTKVELQALDDSAQIIQGLETAFQIKIGVDTGALNNSIQNAQRQVEALTQVSYLLDINADRTQLIEALYDLETAQRKVDELNGRRAEIQVAVIEAQGIQNLGQIDRYIQALNQQKINLNIDSAQLDEVLTKLQRAQQIAQAMGMTVKQLQNELARSQAESNIAGLQQAQAAAQRYYQSQIDGQQKVIAGIQKQAQASDAYYAKQIANVQKVAAAEQARIDKEIAKLQEAGPAERALKEKEIADLREQAAKGATEQERLQAAAQLERYEKEKQIAELEKTKQQIAEEAAAKVEALENERQAKQEEFAARLEAAQERLAAIQEEARQSDLEYQEAIRANQEELNRMAEEERQERRAILEEVLAAKQGYGELETSAQNTADATGNAASSTETLADAAGSANSELESGATAATTINSQLQGAAQASSKIADELARAAQNQQKINLNGGNRWSGGPVSGGTTYTVNELGQEGFLSASGRLRPIRKMPFSQWRAPGSGTVVPAHIMSQIDVPASGVKIRKVASSSTPRKNPANALMRAIRAAIAPRQNNEDGLNKLAEVQARQAVEIGKLSREIGELNQKQWNVSVNLRSNNGTNFLEAVNRMI